MGHYDFVRDLAQAKQTEQKIAKLLKEKYGAVNIEFSNTSDYDISATISGGKVTFEVKEDFMCAFTGNVALEFECRGKPSGIAVSKADYYIYIVHSTLEGKRVKEYILYKTGGLKKLIDNRMYFRTVSGGDPGSNTKNYLFKHKLFTQYGTCFELEEGH